MVIAYIDESGGSGHDLENVYILTATIPLCADPEEYRHALGLLKPPGARKLHWYDAEPTLKHQIIDLIVGLDALHIVVESIEPPETKPERHRRLCLKALLVRLDQMGVKAIELESRGAGGNAADRKLVRTMRTAGSLSVDLAVNHRDGPFEPLLWIPDAVCGAVADRRVGRQDHAHRLSGVIEWIVRAP